MYSMCAFSRRAQTSLRTSSSESIRPMVRQPATGAGTKSREGTDRCLFLAAGRRRHAQVDGHASALGIDDVELHLRQDLFHGIQVEPRARDFRRLLILVEQREETAGVAYGF